MCGIICHPGLQLCLNQDVCALQEKKPTATASWRHVADSRISDFLQAGPVTFIRRPIVPELCIWGLRYFSVVLKKVISTIN